MEVGTLGYADDQNDGAGIVIIVLLAGLLPLRSGDAAGSPKDSEPRPLDEGCTFALCFTLHLPITWTKRHVAVWQYNTDYIRFGRDQPHWYP